MSDTSQGEGWWQASDYKWYPPAAAPPLSPPMAMAAPPAPSLSVTPCPKCGHSMVLDRFACEVCGQVRKLPLGVVLTSPARRLGQYVLEGILVIVTLFIGWLVWSLIVWRRGQTPAMQLLHIRVMKLSTGLEATWGTMFLREFVARGLIMGLIGTILLPATIVLDFMLLWDKKRQQLWDKIAGTIVVNDMITPMATSPFPAD